MNPAKISISFASVMSGLVALLFSSCAAIVSGTTQDINVSSKPSGANVLLEDQLVGTTPTVLQLSRKTSHRVNIHHPGYRDYEVVIEPAANLTSAGNLLVGGIVGGVVDHNTGADNKLVPERVDAVLVRK